MLWLGSAMPVWLLFHWITTCAFCCFVIWIHSVLFFFNTGADTSGAVNVSSGLHYEFEFAGVPSGSTIPPLAYLLLWFEIMGLPSDPSIPPFVYWCRSNKFGSLCLLLIWMLFASIWCGRCHESARDITRRKYQLPYGHPCFLFASLRSPFLSLQQHNVLCKRREHKSR